jgi:hypothetical protein
MGGFRLGVCALMPGVPSRPWRSPPRETRWSGWRAPTTGLAIPLPAGPVQCQPYPAQRPQGSCTLASGQSPQQDLDTDGFQERLPGLNGGSGVPLGGSLHPCCRGHPAALPRGDGLNAHPACVVRPYPNSPSRHGRTEGLCVSVTPEIHSQRGDDFAAHAGYTVRAFSGMPGCPMPVSWGTWAWTGSLWLHSRTSFETSDLMLAEGEEGVALTRDRLHSS